MEHTDYKVNYMKKKILYIITQSELGGAQRYIFDLATNLSEYNVSVAYGEQGDNGELSKMLQENKIKTHLIHNLVRKINIRKDWQAMLEIRKLIKKINPDIVHLNSSKISIIASLSNINIKNKLIYTAHGWVFNEKLSLSKKIFYKLSERWTAKLKNKIICVSEFDKQSAIKNRIEENKLITIHNGISKTVFLEKDEARKKIEEISGQKININETIIGTIGNLYKNKGFEYLITSIKKVKKTKLIIIGDGEERNHLEKLINKYNLESKVLLLGRVNNASKLLKAFDIYINSSLKEGLSYTLLEATQAGLPIIATEVGGNSEIVINEKTGLLIEPASSKIIAKTINYFLKNKNLQQTYSKNAIAKYKNYFDLKTMLQKTKKVYIEK